MPIYTYHCDNCNDEVDEIRSFKNIDAPSDCAKCDQSRRRIIKPPGMVWAPTSGGYR